MTKVGHVDHIYGRGAISLVTLQTQQAKILLAGEEFPVQGFSIDTKFSPKDPWKYEPLPIMLDGIQPEPLPSRMRLIVENMTAIGEWIPHMGVGLSLSLSGLIGLEHMLVDAQERVKHFQEVKPYYFKYNARMRQRTPKIPKRIRRWSHERGYYWQDNMRRYTEISLRGSNDRAYKNFSLAIKRKPVVE